MRLFVVCVLALLVAAPAYAQKAADPACDPATPAAMQLTGVPASAVIGRSYTVGMAPTGVGEATGANGSTLAVKDRHGVGWSAHYQYLSGVSQAFSVGITGAPFVVSGSYSEVASGGTTCTRTLTTALPITRLILGVVGCKRGASEPATLTLRCDGTRLRLSGLTWSGWNGNAPIGHGRLRGRAVRVVLSRPVECAALNGFIYGRAEIAGKRIAIDCPIS